MKTEVKRPVRRKILFALMFAITLVVSLITFTMANFFHADKQAYINDWVSIAAVSTADECQALVQGYRQRLDLYAQIMLNDTLGDAEKVALLQRQFDELPDLIGIALYRGGREVEVADDVNALEAADLTEEDLRQYREDNPLPFAELADGRLRIENSTMSIDAPTFELAFASSLGSASDATDEPLIVSAMFRSDPLMKLGSKFKVFEVSIVSSSGTLLAHPDPSRVARHVEGEIHSDAKTLHQGNQTGMTLEYQRGETEMIAGYAGVDAGRMIVAVEIPKSAAYLASRDLLNRLMLVAFALLLFVSIAGLILARGITRPVERLSQATREIARGDFDVQVDVSSEDEIGALAGSFNKMTSELKNREEALEEAHHQLIQSEKLAAFGQLGAGIAHEVKNPLAGVLGCAQLSLLDVAPGTEIHDNLKLIEKETTRCKQIIENLMKFARQEKTVLEPTDVNPVIQDAMAIVNHQMEMNKVKVLSELEPGLPMIRGNANQLQQVLINLMINAQQAMEGKPGTLRLSTRQVEDQVEIVVRDNGPGIPEEIRAKLFEPFFTTKATGKGTGLGLSVSYGIVKDHEGEIVIQSELGQGAAFVITIPALSLEQEDVAGLHQTDLPQLAH